MIYFARLTELKKSCQVEFVRQENGKKVHYFSYFANYVVCIKVQLIPEDFFCLLTLQKPTKCFANFCPSFWEALKKRSNKR